VCVGRKIKNSLASPSGVPAKGLDGGHTPAFSSVRHLADQEDPAGVCWLGKNSREFFCFNLINQLQKKKAMAVKSN